jgi:glycosyltransferase involved in cell wall biosynthesis
MFRLWVGADYQVFRPTKKTKQQFVAYYHGKFIPLHGVDVIVEAAKVLENKGVEFRLLGGGQLEAKIKTKVKKLKLNKIKFLSKVDYIELPKYALQASVFLAGPFGTTSKARRVIPNKIFEALGMGLPTIVGDTKATRELLTDKEVIFVNPGDSKELAKKILWVKNNFGKAKIIAKKGRAKIKKESSPKVLGKKLKEKLNELIH